MRVIKSILIVCLAVLCLVLWFTGDRGPDPRIQKSEAKIDSLEDANEILKGNILQMSQKLVTADKNQLKAEKKADSIARILKNPHSCEETVRLQG